MELDNSVPDEVVDERAVEILQQVLTLVIHYATEVHSIKSGKYKGESVCRVGAPADLKRKNELYLSTGPRDVKLSCDDASRINFQVEYINDEEFRNGRPEVGAQVSFVPDNYPPSQCVWVEV